MMTNTVAIIIQAVSPEFSVASSSAASASTAGAESAAVASVAAISPWLSAKAMVPVLKSPSSEMIRSSFLNMTYPFLKCCCAGLAGADSYDLLEVKHKNLSVTNLAGACGFFDGFERLVENVV